jgi:hypothetical protein
VVGGLCVSANAQEVLISMGNDVGGFRGISVSPNPDANSHEWNSLVPGTTYTGLLSTAGPATTVGILWTTGVGTDSYNGPYGNATSSNLAVRQTEADTVTYSFAGDLNAKRAGFSFAAGSGALDGVGPNPNESQFTLSGLNPLATYSMTFYGSHVYDTFTTTYSVYGDALYTALPLGSASLNVEAAIPTGGESPNLSNTVTISGLVPTAGGILYVEFAGDTSLTNGSSGSGMGYLNSMELLGVVPEPASLASILAIGGLLSFRRRRMA